MGPFGIDVSNNNGVLDFSDLSSVPAFVFAKVTEGTFYVDETFPVYRTLVGQLTGSLFGGYHFAHPEVKTPAAEAEFFCQQAEPFSGMPLWIDYEVYSGSNSYDAEWINTFRNTVRSEYKNAKVGLYADLTGMDNVLGEIEVDALWLAWYNDYYETPTGPMPKGYSWDIHQYEIINNLDQDYSRKTVEELQEIFTW